MKTGTMLVGVAAIAALFGSGCGPGDNRASNPANTPELADSEKLGRGDGQAEPGRARGKSQDALDEDEADVIGDVVYQSGEDEPYDGVLRFDHSDGSPRVRVQMKDGKPDGTMRVWDADGTKRLQARYAGGRLERLRRWDSDGQELTDDISDDGGDPFLQVVGGIPPAGGSPADGSPENDPNAEDPGETGDGLPASELPAALREFDVADIRTRNGRAYLADGGEPFTGREVAEFDDGTRREREYFNGLPHGSWATFHSNGETRVEEHYVNGAKDGPYKIWFENGQPRYETNFREGREVGISTHWNADGKITGRWERTEDGRRIDLLE